MRSWRLLGVGAAALMIAGLVSLALSAPAEAPAAPRQAQGGVQIAATPIVREFPVITHPSGQELPAISGNIVVWEDWRNGTCYGYSNCDIYGKNLVTGVEFAVVTNTAAQSSPAISGDIIVWTDYRNGEADIYGKNLSTGAEFPITTNPARQWYPAISGNIVVWEDDRNGDFDIYGKDLNTGAEFPVATGRGDQVGAATSGNVVVWEDQSDPNGNSDIYGRNLATGTQFQVTSSPDREWGAAISGNIVVWVRYGSREGIYGKDLATGAEFPVATNYAEGPAISGNIVVWWRFGGVADIYARNLPTGSEFPVAANPAGQFVPAISGNIVVWEDWRNGNPDIYGARLEWPLAVENVRASPNPFNPNTGTTISFTLSKAANAALVVLDGELNPVRSMGPVARPEGPGAFLWDGRNQGGQVISAGLYVPVVVAAAGAESAYGYTLATADNGVAPAVTNVAANPNPIIPPGGTTVSYQVSKGSVQVLLVLNESGTEVRRIIAGYKKGRPVSIYWNGRNNAGQYVPNGSYILVPVAVDLLGRVGFNFIFVQVGTGPAMSVLDAQKVASAWVEAHRDELAGLIRGAVESRLNGLP